MDLETRSRIFRGRLRNYDRTPYSSRDPQSSGFILDSRRHPEERPRGLNQHGATRSATSSTSCPPDTSPAPLVVRNICAQRCELQSRRCQCHAVPILQLVIVLWVCNGGTAGERSASGEVAGHGITSGSTSLLLLLRREIHQHRELVPPLSARGGRLPAPRRGLLILLHPSFSFLANSKLRWIWLGIHRDEVTWGGSKQLARVVDVGPKLT